MEGLQVLQDAHRAREDREVLRRKFDLWDEEPEIMPVPAIELGVRERLQELKRQMIDVYGAADAAAKLSCGSIPHRPSDAVGELLERREDLLETE